MITKLKTKKKSHEGSLLPTVDETIHMTADFLLQTMETGRNWHNIHQVVEEMSPQSCASRKKTFRSPRRKVMGREEVLSPTDLP